MKKTMAFIWAVLILFCLSGCGKKPVDENANPAEQDIQAPDTEVMMQEHDTEGSVTDLPILRDRTIPFAGIDMAGKEVAVTGSGEADISTSYLTAESLVRDSAYIVKGQVVKVTYSHTEGNAITFYDVRLDDVWADRVNQGDESLMAGDMITIYQPGGFVTSEEFVKYRSEKLDIAENSLVRQDILGIPFPEEGDEYVLFLTDSPEPAYEGVFMVTGVYQGRYVLQGETISRYYPDEENPYLDDGQTLQQLYDTVQAALADDSLVQQPSIEDTLDNYLNRLRSLIEFTKQGMEEYGEEETEEELAASRRYIEQLESQIAQLPLFMDRVLSRADQVTEEKTDSPKVLLLSHTSPEKAYGGDSFASTLIERAGGTNAAQMLTSYNGQEAPVTMEEIAEMNPDIIIIYSTIHKDYYTAEDILAKEELQNVNAVKTGRVYEADVNDSWFGFEGTEYNFPCGWLGVAYLQTLLYPEEYSEEQFKADVKEFYTIMDQLYTYESKFGTD